MKICINSFGGLRCSLIIVGLLSVRIRNIKPTFGWIDRIDGRRIQTWATSFHKDYLFSLRHIEETYIFNLRSPVN